MLLRLSLVAFVHLGAVKSRKNKSMNTVNSEITARVLFSRNFMKMKH